MTKLRGLVVVLAVSLLVGGWSLGDDKKDDAKKDAPPPKLKGQLPANWKKLGLAEDQVQKVYKVQNDYRAKIDALEEKIKQTKSEEKTEMMKVLTDAQKARLKEISESK